MKSTDMTLKESQEDLQLKFNGITWQAKELIREFLEGCPGRSVSLVGCCAHAQVDGLDAEGMTECCVYGVRIHDGALQVSLDTRWVEDGPDEPDWDEGNTIDDFHKYSVINWLSVLESVATLHPTGHGPGLTVKQFHCPDSIEQIRDSMQLDSSQELVSLSVRSGLLDITASVTVQGRVRVIFRDEVYRSASRMPSLLLECFRTGTDPAEAAPKDGHTYETPYYCDENNWFELAIVQRDRDGNVTDDSSLVIDVPDDNTAEGWKAFLTEEILSAIKENG